MNDELSEFYTFKKNRRCIFCKKPIPDQEHALRKYCKRKVLPDGSIQSCKDDCNSKLRKVKNLAYKKIAEHHKEMDNQIERLFEAYGGEATLELINQYGIELHKPVEFKKDEKTGRMTFYFGKFVVEEINNENYKINRHARIL